MTILRARRAEAFRAFHPPGAGWVRRQDRSAAAPRPRLRSEAGVNARLHDLLPFSTKRLPCVERVLGARFAVAEHHHAERPVMAAADDGRSRHVGRRRVVGAEAAPVRLIDQDVPLSDRDIRRRLRQLEIEHEHDGRRRT
jgi:hypothetical protein